MTLPENHSHRFVLANEVHARPYEALELPTRASHIALLQDGAERERGHAHLAALCERYGAYPPPADAIHFSADLGTFRVKWERHTEFSNYTFFVRGRNAAAFGEPAIRLVPEDWIAALPGRTIMAAHAELLQYGARLPDTPELAAYFSGNAAIGAEVGGGAGAAFTDFRIHEDGFSRFVIFDRSFTRSQAGRMVLRMFEIETYRMMALLALPLARSVGGRLAALERELTDITTTIAQQTGADERLLEQLTRVAAEGERTMAADQYRFSAARAYHDLVLSRIADLRESRIQGVQTIEEFMARRLAPAMATCESVAGRELALSERVARASHLLSTRVDIVREKQNQALLASMDRRAKLQLRLQETVEGLSVVAVTYYAVGLVAYAAKALKIAGIALDAELAAGIAIPIVAVIAALGVRRIRKMVTRAQAREMAEL